MFYKVVTITLVLLVQITYQGKLRSRRKAMHFFNESYDYFGQHMSQNGRQIRYLSKWFDKNHRTGRDQNPKPKSRFFDVMNFIMQTPDYGLKYTEDHQTQTQHFPGFPGFHNLIEMRGPTKYRYVTVQKQYNIPRIHNQKKNKMKTPYHDPPESRELETTKSYQLDEVDFSKEQFSTWENSHESYKRRPGSNLLKNMKPSTSMPKLNRRLRYSIAQVFSTTAVAKVPEISSISNSVSFAPPELFDKIDPLPYKQVKTRDQELESDEDEDDERSKHLEDY